MTVEMQQAIELQKKLAVQWNEEDDTAYHKLWNSVCARYPSLFDGHDLGTQVGGGWWGILEDSFKQVVVIMEDFPEYRFSVAQIKEKFGGLRFYTNVQHRGSLEEEELDTEKYSADGIHARLDAVITEAEQRASITCEVCGEVGERRALSWLRVLCDDHYKIAKEAQRIRGF